ncbi:centrosome and spindle pole-associated protein 1-like isoform X34 [Ostrea edulis]|uniref:centrosome and spindle pole-associated protein 1-like isoform X34 n=1 Tax=Ostrea edulis TaxID=37623 RepID=UPI0024AEDA63|nr:centrosome and spindle pole-associated protein 1-like isoform X34 [Ostrea edulis]
MAAAVENDIEEFIRNQKAKLQQERQYISHQKGGLRSSPRKPDMDYNETERQFQEQRRREYNEFLSRPKFKKAPTPPQSGMKFGEYEDFRKRVAQQRKEEYREELEKQTLEQAITKARGKLDISIPRNHQNPQAVSQEDVNRLSQEKQRRNIRDKMVEDKRIKEFERMLHMHHEDKLTDYMEEERNRILEDYPLREQDIQAMFQRQREEREKQKQNEEREREIQRKQFEFQRKLDDNYVRDSGDYGYQGRNAARSEPPVRRNDQYDAPRQQSEYVPPRRGDYSPPRQDYSPRRDENEGFTDRLHQRYEDERRQEYQNYVQKRNAQATNRSWNEPDDTESGLPLTNDFKHKQQMELERNQEYNEFMKKKYNKNKAPAMKQTGNNPSVGQYEDKKKRLQQERQREYREMMDKKEQDRGKGRRGEQPRNRSPDNFLSGLGKHQEEREKLNDERKKEYNHMLAEDLPRRDRPRDPPPEPEEPPPRSESYEASLHGLRSHESAEVRRKQTRNEEYNEFLKQKREQEKHRFDNKKYGELKDGIYATLPGLHYNGSAERRKVETRNKEYNEFLRNSQENLSRRGGGGGNKPPAGARRGWQSPGYEENRKRREEAQYRRDEPQAERRIRAYASDGAINRAGNDRRSNGDERDYGRRGRHRSDRNRDKGILDDDNWLTNRGEPEDEYQDLESDPPRQRGGPPPNRSPPVDREEMAKANYFATLPVGANDRDSANARKKARYREELQLQMREAEAARRREKEREKVEELRVNASGLLDPEKTSRRLRYLGDPSPTPRRNVRSPEVKPYHTRFDLSPRGGQGNVPESSGGYTPRERGRPRERRQRDTSGILDIGFDGFLEQPRRGGASQIPPGLQYQPSLLDFTSLDRFADPSIEPTRTYVTGGGTGGVNQPYSSIDEAYHYYGMKNPLEPENNRKRNPYGAPPLDLGGGYDRPYQGRGTPRVTFDESSHKNSILKDDKRQKFEKKDEKIQTVDKKDETVQTIEITVPPPPTTARARDRSKERISPYQFPSDEDFRSRSQNDKRSYQEELDRQIEEKRRKKQLEKEEQLRYERKLDDEIRNYNPFGKGGGGAPLRDTKGNVVADLRGMHNTNQDPDTARSQVTRESPRFQAPTSPRDDLIGQPPPQIDAAGDVTHARGGHGIFGQPKTEQEKTTSDKYKDDLRRQIEEKKRREQIEKEKERMEEEKENRRLEEQRLRIQSEFEEEQRKKREKEDEARKRNEEMQQQAEARKKEAKRKKQEEDDQRMQEKREQENRERQERQEQRGSSPPVPALRTGDQKPDYSEAISNSSSSRQNHFRSESVRLGMGTPDSLGLKKPYGISTSEDTRKSPPIPALRRDTPPSESSKPPPQPLSRANSSDVLKELASMRKQLQSERKRVENALETQRNEPDVFDPRVVQRPPPKEIDVFERARQGEPAPVRADANPRNLQEFNELKYKNDTESRKAFRSMFPDAPTSNETLEAQQDALLRHQEDTLKSMKEQRFTPTNYNAWKGRRSDRSLGAPPMTTRQGTVSPRSMLNSNSAFIDVDGLNHFPDDFEDLPKRNESARYRRRERVALSPRVDSVGYNPPESQPLNPFGSTTSLDVDRIQRKNDARLRRLHNLNADEVSLADPDDILDRFMAKQRYNRPPSGQTLQDDTWLRPASKAI